MLAYKKKYRLQGYTHIGFKDGTIIISTEFHDCGHLEFDTKGGRSTVVS